MRKTPTEDDEQALQRIAQEADQRSGLLDLSGLEVTLLPPQLAALTHLAELRVECFFNKNTILDLAPLATLTDLQKLSLAGVQITGLQPLSGLSALRQLTLVRTSVRDLAPLAALSSLDTLHCLFCELIDWDSLPTLPLLTTLMAPNCQMTDASPITRLAGLRKLFLYANPLLDVGPLAALGQIEHLNISRTQVSELRPLQALTRLKTLNCSATPATDWQSIRPLWEASSLSELIACDVNWPGLPTEVLSQDDWTDNCLPRLRAHLADLQAGATAQRQTKLMVLGNGRVGKTQLVRRLRDDPFDESVPSTHGVVVTSATLPAAIGRAADTLHVWDFGGQDLYHGTHSLFMKSGSTALVAWTPAADSAGTHVHQGMRFRNEPLSYWLEFVQSAAGPSAPLLVVQTQCDQASDELLTPPAPPDLLNRFQQRKLLHHSARSGRGFAALNEALQEAVAALLAQQGEVTIGAGRARLIDRLAGMRDDDAARPQDQRQHRTLSLQRFAELCEAVGGISDPLMALDYLHRCGWVFYRDDMFNQAIVLDQAWALENIYAVFHRSHSYHHIRALRGRFTLGLLQDTVWRGKSATESGVLLDMMRSCEVCFEVRAADENHGIEAEYIAPELLPEAAQLADSLDAERAKMPADAPSAELRLRFKFLHSGHLRAALSRVGRCAGEQAWYWREGFLGYEVRHQAWLELGVQRDATGHGGSLWFRAVGAQVAELLDKVRQTMPADWGDPEGADSFERGGDRALRRAAAAQAVYPEPAAATPTAPLSLAFAPSPRSDPRPRVAISYAWGDKTPAGQQREALVDRLCAQSQARYAIPLWRDADVMKQGERISRFMGELAAHDRIIVVLSDKYLKSEYCMFELSEIWRLARRDGDAFLARVTVWALPDARLHSILERLAIAKHWRDYFKALDQAVRKDPALLGESDMAKYKQIERYASEVGEMLALIADTLLPRNEDADFEPFLQRSLGG